MGELLASERPECAVRRCQDVRCGQRRSQGLAGVLHRSENHLHQTLKQSRDNNYVQ